MRVAYLGPPGTYSEEAAIAWEPSAERIPVPSIPAVAEAVEQGQADCGVVAIENSIEGSVTFTVDVLLGETPLAICGELIVPIDHVLIARHGTDVADVKRIYGHPQALGQCKRYLDAHFRGAEQVAALSNTAAVIALESAPESAVAIGPARAAELYGAAILARGIQDVANNQTRFVVLAPEDHERTGRDKTSIGFATHQDRPGALVSVLSEFAYRGINLTRIESRPSRTALGNYVFLVDMEGHRTDGMVRQAFEAIAPKVTMFRVFGSYPAAGST